MDQGESVREAYSRMSEQYIALFDGDWQGHEDDIGLIGRHLTGLPGPVLDLGCGPGYWSAHLHSLGVDVTGVDMVPEFIAHARATHSGPEFRLESMIEPDIDDHSVSGILSWYSSIHLAPTELDRALTEFRRLLTSSGVIVIGFFDSDDGVAAFDHAVTTAYRRPADIVAQHVARAGFTEVERSCRPHPTRADRKHAAIAARLTQ